MIKKLLRPSLPSPTGTTAREIKLLCYCIHPAFDRAVVAQINEAIEQGVNWQSLIEMATVHGVLPLLSKRLTGLGEMTPQAPEPARLASTNISLNKTSSKDAALATKNSIPADVLKRLKAAYHLNDFRNQYQARELIRVLDLLSENTVPAVPFKGPVLAVEAYGALALRRFTDLDILVSEKDFVTARDLLLENGYQRTKKFWGIANLESQETALMHRWGEYPLSHSNGQYHIDLHSRLIGGEFPILSADFDVFWQRLSTTTLLQREVSTFSLEDLLLYLCVHGSKDLWKRLSWVSDVAVLVEGNPELDWSIVIERSIALDSEQMLWLGLSLAESLLGTTLPEIALSRRRSHFTQQALFTQIKAQLMSGVSPSLIDYTPTQRVYFHGRLLGNRRDQLIHYLKFAKHLLLHRFKPNIYDKAFVELPPALYGLYYLIRPVRLLVEVIKASNKVAASED